MSSVLIKNIPNYLTIVNLASGVSALLLIFKGEFHWVFICLLISLVADLLDGLMARLLNATGPLGVQLDSLADLVSFGVMPAVFLFAILDNQGLSPTETYAIAAASLFYAASAAWRLAKFNITEDTKGDFFGLPSPAAGLFLMSYSYLMISESVWPFDHVFSGPILAVALGIFMLLSVRFASLKFSSAGHLSNLYRYAIILLCPLPILFWGLSAAFYSIVIYFIISILSNFFPLDKR